MGNTFLVLALSVRWPCCIRLQVVVMALSDFSALGSKKWLERPDAQIGNGIENSSQRRRFLPFFHRHLDNKKAECPAHHRPGLPLPGSHSAHPHSSANRALRA